jgi:hypothetical protein
MRVLVSILFSVVAVFAQDPQASAPDAQAPDKLSIPVQLSRTIDTKKCKTGDLVEMRTLEPVLIANGLVMPENAKLRGRVLGAASRQNDQPSWVVLVLERAKWKHHTVPLHAFVASRITLRAPVSGRANSAFEDTMPGAVRRRRPGLIPSAPGRMPSSAPSHPLQDAIVERSDGAQFSDPTLDDLRIAQGKNGTVFLVSRKPHLKLPSGTLFMLRNQATVVPDQPITTQVASSPK